MTKNVLVINTIPNGEIMARLKELTMSTKNNIEWIDATSLHFTLYWM